MDDGVGLDEDLVNGMLISNFKEYMHLKNIGLHSLTVHAGVPKQGSSVGLKNVDMRIKLLFGSNMIP